MNVQRSIQSLNTHTLFYSESMQQKNWVPTGQKSRSNFAIAMCNCSLFSILSLSISSLYSLNSHCVCVCVIYYYYLLVRKDPALRQMVPIFIRSYFVVFSKWISIVIFKSLHIQVDLYKASLNCMASSRLNVSPICSLSSQKKTMHAYRRDEMRFLSSSFHCVCAYLVRSYWARSQADGNTETEKKRFLFLTPYDEPKRIRASNGNANHNSIEYSFKKKKETKPNTCNTISIHIEKFVYFSFIAFT